MGLNKKQIICLVFGLAFALAGIGFGIWAGVSGMLDNHDVPPSKMEPEPMDRSKGLFILGPSGNSYLTGQPENVRIIASISTKRPIHFNPTPATSERLSKYTRIGERLRASTSSPSFTSFFDLPDTETTVLPRPFPIHHDGHVSKGRNQGYLNIGKLLNTAGKIFGMDLSKEDLQSTEKNPTVTQDQTNWVTLSYLSLSVFLLKQMDKLLNLEQMSLNKTGDDATKGRMVQDTISNSLNLLFLDPAGSNTTDFDELLIADADADAAGFSRVVLNIVKASQMYDGDGIDCIWSAYCVELNHRARREGMAGSVARLNAVLMELVTGQLTPSSVLNRMISSIIEWHDVDCKELFPTCEPSKALNFLVELVTIPAQ